jgi:1,2-diacylglycerol 3-alpha-glucosyltransferase
MVQRTDPQVDYKPIKIAFLSAGLGNISRGFEISCRTWFDEVKSITDLDARLFSGGKIKTATHVWNWPRNGSVASFLRYFKLINDGCRLEQITFSFGFLFHLLFYSPHVIWLQEATLGNMLLKFRKIFGFKYELIFCDGAPVGHNFAKRFDYLVFLHQYALDDAISDGIDPKRCCVIPHLSLSADSSLDKLAARFKMNIAEDKFVIICVAAWNKHHKRIDYLLKEIASIKSKKVMLLLCGQPEIDSDLLKKDATELGIDMQWHTLSQAELTNAYVASDLFVLPSLNEALGAVLIEAGVHGLPVICHPHQAGKFIFGKDYSGLTDLSEKGNLTKKILDFTNAGHIEDEGYKTKDIVSRKFNRQSLTADLVNYIKYIYQQGCSANCL